MNPRRTRVLIVDDRSRDRATLDYLDEPTGITDLACRVTRAPNLDDRSNYSRLMNHAAVSSTPPCCTSTTTSRRSFRAGWTRWRGDVTTGRRVVGAKLLFHDGLLQHGGVAVSLAHGVPDHLFRKLRGGDRGYQWLPHRVRNVSAVTGACLLTRTNLFVT